MDTALAPSAVAIVEDVWLASVMGRPVFRITIREASALEEIAEDLHQHRAQFPNGLYVAKFPTTQVRLVAWLTSLGFVVVDVLVELAVKPRTPLPLRAYQIGRVRPATPDDCAAVCAIATYSFVHTRFHLDPQIPQPVANEVKRAWAESYFTANRGRLWVAEHDGVVRGFLGALETPGCSRIDLMALSMGAQGQGFGRALVTEFLYSATVSGAWMTGWPCEVGTQAANVEAIALYESLGFRTTRTQYVLHGHSRVVGEGQG